MSPATLGGGLFVEFMNEDDSQQTSEPRSVSESTGLDELYAALRQDLSIDEIRGRLEELGAALESIDRSKRVRPETYRMQFGVQNR